MKKLNKLQQELMNLLFMNDNLNKFKDVSDKINSVQNKFKTSEKEIREYIEGYIKQDEDKNNEYMFNIPIALTRIYCDFEG